MLLDALLAVAGLPGQPCFCCICWRRITATPVLLCRTPPFPSTQRPARSPFLSLLAAG